LRLAPAVDLDGPARAVDAPDERPRLVEGIPRVDLTRRRGDAWESCFLPAFTQQYFTQGTAAKGGCVTRSLNRPTAEVVNAIRALSERRLNRDEFDAYVDAPMSDDERNGIDELIDWFRCRYPHPLDRLKSARRAYARTARRSP
jgi:hypothetical protein